ncbi:hypothetical protein ACFL6C_00390 [Myxococcota bacterium]
MRAWCRLCNERTAEGSMFCAKHQRQAARFSVSFGRQPEEPERQQSSRSEDPPAGSRGADLAAVFLPTWETVRKRLAAGNDADANRWPQISVYYLEDRLFARPYFSIVPAPDDNPSLSLLDLSSTAVASALAQGGNVLEAIVELFETHLDDLKTHTIQTLDVHFVTYAGLIAINRHAPGEKDINLITFETRESGLAAVPIDDVRQRLRHTQW